MKAQGLPVLYGHGLQALWLHLRSAAVFCSCGVSKDILGISINKKTKVFNLWHGTPMKKIGWDVIESGVGVKASLARVSNDGFLLSKLKKILRKPYTTIAEVDNYILSPSEEVGRILAQAFQMNDNSVLNLGYPKLDHLFAAEKNYSNKILYAPTYRGEYDSEYNVLEAFGFDVDEMNAWLLSKGYTLSIKLHPANTLPCSLIKKINNSKYIEIIDCPDIYEVLGNYCFVITDFSSIFFDGLAIGANVILAPFGYEDYTNADRQLYYDLSEIFPHIKSYNWQELLCNFDIYQVLSNTEQRIRFYKYLDSNSSQRLFEKVSFLLNSQKKSANN